MTNDATILVRYRDNITTIGKRFGSSHSFRSKSFYNLCHSKLGSTELYTNQMFELGNKFFTDFGLLRVTQTFWNKPLIEKLKDRDSVITGQLQISSKIIAIAMFTFTSH